jgi:hypothetical protein
MMSTLRVGSVAAATVVAVGVVGLTIVTCLDPAGLVALVPLSPSTSNSFSKVATLLLDLLHI